MKLLIAILFFSLLTCNSNQEGVVKNNKNECSIFNEKYLEYSMLNKKDSALYYIDKAIDCNPKDDFFKTEKIKSLIHYEDYNSAISFAKKLAKENDPNFKLLYGTLLLKMNDENAEIQLKEAYNLFSINTKNYNQNDSSLDFYKIGLDNYFKGKKYSLLMLEKFKKNYPDKNNLQSADYLENLINTTSKESVLYKLFDIKD